MSFFSTRLRNKNPAEGSNLRNNITVDGCCDHTKQIADEETHEYFTHLMREFDLLVFGRKTYQLMVPYWPDVAKNQSETKADIEFARTFDSMTKIVLKQEPGENILIGGVDIPSQLIERCRLVGIGTM